jgi:hypothetical protein
MVRLGFGSIPLILATASAVGASGTNTTKPEKPVADPWRRFELSLGYFFASLDSELQIGSKALGVAANIDVEEFLHLDETTDVFRAGASYRISGRHRISADYYDLSRSATNRLGIDISVDGEVYNIGTTLESTYDLRFFNVSYGYSFLQDDRMDIAATLGVHGIDLGISLKAAESGKSETEEFFLPLPLPGLRADFALTSYLLLRQRLEILWLKIDEYEGLLVDTMIGLELSPIDHFGLGIAYHALRFDLEMEDDDFLTVDFKGELELDYSGLMLYGVFYF